MNVSLICTVKNEESSVEEFLDSLLSQSRPPDEIIIVDGGSADRTVEIIKSYINNGVPIKLIVKNGINIAEGRNIAIKKAKYDIIASTDAGCRIDKQWLENLINPFLEDQSVDAVSGWYEADAGTEFERCVARLTYPKLKKMLQNPNKFLPSSRSVAYKKKCWEKVGGYPEWLYTAEDTLFDLNLKKAGYKFVFVPGAVVRWKVRKDLRSVFKQFYLYSEGDGKAALISKRYYLRIFLYLIGLTLLILGFAAEFIWGILLAAVFTYLLIPIIMTYSNIQTLNMFVKVPILWLMLDIAHICGYVAGTLKRLTIILRSNVQGKIYNENIE